MRLHGVLFLATLLAAVSACSKPAPTEPAAASNSSADVKSAIPAASTLPVEGQITHQANRLQAISKLYDVDRIYKSMQGPWSVVPVKLSDSPERELLWITGCHVEMVAPNGRTPMPEQFMCHTNLDIPVEKHAELFGFSKQLDGRLFTLSQGQLHVAFPPGFGIPIMSDESLDLATQVLNLNPQPDKFQVRHKVHIDFVRQKDLRQPMQALYECGVSGQVSLEGRSLVFGMDDDLAQLHGDQSQSLCIPGKSAATGDKREDRYGRVFSGHWVVQPGREENHTRVTEIMNLPFDTKIHYIAVHMHPFAESLELRDMTTGETLFKSQAKNYANQIGLERMDSLSSEEGLPVYQNHEYELISVYNNTTDVEQDSMAVMYLYLADQEFKLPKRAD